MNVFPDIEPTRSGFTISFATKSMLSPYNQVEEIWEEPGDKWHISLRWAFLTKAEGRRLRAHLLALRGHSGVTFIEDTAHSNDGSWNGTPVVHGSNQYGVQLTARGFAASQTVAKAGDRFQLGNRLHELTEDAVSNASGIVTLNFQPEIITIPLDGDFLIHNRPRVRAMLKDPEKLPSFSGTKAGFRNIQVDFQEALR
ncbi:hypothetical protein [Idiomarina sp.]|uniref:hypothetical protein n=1 Tax=Idiomarina sp. TaxID=1874361 RepID=UPI0025BBDA62|nr:hypothetical protein [Idiomarina sp.]NQZ03590.1 hypothetical protein [Idiomarina sp.]